MSARTAVSRHPAPYHPGRSRGGVSGCTRRGRILAGPRRSIGLALLALACFLSLVACGATRSPSLGSPERQSEVLAAVEAYYRDLSARDWEAFASHFWPDARLTTIWQAQGAEAPTVFSTDVPEFVRRAPEGPDSASIFEEHLVEAEVLVTANLAVVWATYEAAFGEPGELQRWSGVDAITLMEHEGRWAITSIAFAAQR